MIIFEFTLKCTSIWDSNLPVLCLSAIVDILHICLISQAVFHLWLLGFFLEVLQALVPIRHPTIPIMFGCPLVCVIGFVVYVFFWIYLKFLFHSHTSLCEIWHFILHPFLVQLLQELWLVSWVRGSTDPENLCRQGWWLEQGKKKSCFNLNKHSNLHRGSLYFFVFRLSDVFVNWEVKKQKICFALFYASLLLCSSLLMVAKLSVALLQKPQESWYCEDSEMYPYVWAAFCHLMWFLFSFLFWKYDEI